jgi:hypothetical protein
MKQFLLYLPLSFYLEAASFIFSVCCFQALKRNGLQLLVFVTGVIFIIEAIGFYMKWQGNFYNGYLYNILNFVQVPVWGLLLRKQFRRSKPKRISLFALILYVAGALTNMLFFQGFTQFNNLTLMAGSIIIVVHSCYFFYELLLAEDDTNPLGSGVFWIASGLLLFFTGTFFYFSLYDYLMHYQLKNNTQIFNLIIFNLSTVLYCCIILGILISQFGRWKRQ